MRNTNRHTATAAQPQKGLPSPETGTERGTSHHQPSHDQIALLAYQMWEERGRPEGSPEDDWFRAEKQLLA